LVVDGPALSAGEPDVPRALARGCRSARGRLTGLAGVVLAVPRPPGRAGAGEGSLPRPGRRARGVYHRGASPSAQGGPWHDRRRLPWLNPPSLAGLEGRVRD